MQTVHTQTNHTESLQDQLVRSIKIRGMYQHYRGDRYKVLAVSRHSEDLSWYVVYEALYDNPVSKILLCFKRKLW